MSKVIAFRVERSRKPVPRIGGEAGQILLFTGVRYIRDEDEATLATPAPRAGTTASLGPVGERLQA